MTEFAEVPMGPLGRFLKAIHAIKSTGGGVDESSFYPPLEGLLNEIGDQLRPKVQCVSALADLGAGRPDFGLFTYEQVGGTSGIGALEGLIPERGAVEAKPPSDPVETTAKTKQVKDYLERYGLVLVTNYRDFLFLKRGREDKPDELERFILAESDQEFWSIAAGPKKLDGAIETRFVEFLKRVLLYAAPLALPQDVAWQLSSYARDALSRVEHADLAALRAVRDALEKALDLKFQGPRGEHFFRSSLVQTLFYGAFAAWVLWSREPHRPHERFDWKLAGWLMHLPVIQALFHQVATPGQLEPLGVTQDLDRATRMLGRVADSFFEKFEGGEAIQYFYEPFLQAFDPLLRKELGIWYTPPEIVRYMVGRVDTVLREHLAIADGLADSRVYVLDPCCGTGAYLVEVLRRIARQIEVKRGKNDALVADEVKRAALERIRGFEILPAPYVIAHLQIQRLLRQMGAPLSEDERARIYLANALTDSALGNIRQLALPFEEEHRGAWEAKHQEPILVVIGNPPYNAYAGVSPKEEQGLVDIYKRNLRKEWGIKKFNLDDMYVRFIRFAERRIVERTGKGIVSLISNFSYLQDASFVVMRERLVREFDYLWFDNLNGDSRETGKLTSDGKPDPSVFSTELNPEGIRVGTAIGLLVRKSARSSEPVVRYREFWGSSKRADLEDSLLERSFDSQYRRSAPTYQNRLSFRPVAVSNDFLAWPALTELCAEPPSNGLMEKRHGALIDIDRHALNERMELYFERNVTWQQLGALGTGLTQNAARFEAKRARQKLLSVESFSKNRLIRYVVRPFDSRWCYYTPVRPLWNEPRPSLWRQYRRGNDFLISRPGTNKKREGIPVFFTKELADDHLLSPDAACFPFRLHAQDSNSASKLYQRPTLVQLEGDLWQSIANLSPESRSYLESLELENPDTDTNVGELIWLHALAVSHAPDYLHKYADGLRKDWPHIPLPVSKTDLLRSAQYGRLITYCLDSSADIPGTIGKTPYSNLQCIAAISRVDGTPLNPGKGDLAVTAGWGHFGKDHAVMPGRGRAVLRGYTNPERTAIERGVTAFDLDSESVFSLLGGQTFDIWLNGVAYWRNVPKRVWDFHIGGYQVIKKWLSYREQGVLGRALHPEEVRDVSDMTRRIAALVLLEPALNANYKDILKNGVWDWRRPEPAVLAPHQKQAAPKVAPVDTAKRTRTGTRGKMGTRRRG